MIPASPSVPLTELTSEQIAAGSRYLAETRDGAIAATAGMTAAEWNFKPAPDRWSVAEIVEHLALLEQRIHALIRMINDAPLAPDDWDPNEMDQRIVRDMPESRVRAQAPEHVRPTNRWSGVEALENFVRGREQTITLLSAPSLRRRLLPHPVFGPWDGYQWLMAAGAHCARHTQQIADLRACPDFPNCAATASAEA